MHIIMFFIFLFLTTPSIAVDTILMPMSEKADMVGMTCWDHSRSISQTSIADAIHSAVEALSAHSDDFHSSKSDNGSAVPDPL